MATVSSATDLSSTYYLRNFYSYNRSAMKKSGRTDFSDVELSYEDSRALHRAAKALSKHDFSELENGGNVYSTIMAFVDTYNNTLDSAKDLDSDSSKRYSKKLKSLMSQYKSELDDIGISINRDGSLKANENLVKAAKMDDVKKVFGKEEGLTKALKSISKKMNSAAYNDVYSAITNTGLNINITL